MQSGRKVSSGSRPSTDGDVEFILMRRMTSGTKRKNGPEKGVISLQGRSRSPIVVEMSSDEEIVECTPQLTSGSKRRSGSGRHHNNVSLDSTPVSLVETAEQKALRNNLVVKLIMKHVTHIRDLLNFRLVSSCWEHEATRELLVRDGLQVFLESTSNTFIHQPKVNQMNRRASNTDMTLTQLNKFISQSRFKLPCTSFSFTGGDLMSTHAHQFFTTSGKLITSLSIVGDQYKPCLTSKRTFYKILTLLAPNIKTLEIGSSLQFDWKPEDPLQLPPLPAIKSFVMPCPVYPDVVNDTVIQILRAAVNLQSIENFHVGQYKKIEEMGHLPKVKSLVGFGKIKSGLGSTLQDHVTLANLEPSSLESVNFKWIDQGRRRLTKLERDQVTNASFKILNSSKETLKKLTLGPGYSPFPGGHFHFPDMKKLEFLSLSRFRDNFQMNLTGRLSTVKYLEMKDNVNLTYLLKLHGLCPNVTHLTVYFKNNKTLGDLFQNVMRAMPQLIVLKLFIVEVDHEFPNLDSTFTGLSESCCAWLDLCNPNVPISGLDKMRSSRAWIGNIAGLKYLDIHFNGWSSFLDHKYLVPYRYYPMTRLSFLYGFHFLPQCQVTVTYNKNMPAQAYEEMKTMLRPVRPFIAISEQGNWTRMA